MANNNKLLYLTVFVAALFVATISGTFAYFQASASNNNVIGGDIASVNITLSVNKIAPSTAAPNGTDLIPFDLISGSTINTNLLTSTNANSPGAFASECIDNYGYTACDIYKIAVKADNPLLVDGYLKIGPVRTNVNDASTESVITNLKWMLIGPRTSTSVNRINNINSSIYNTSNYMINSKVKSTISYSDYTSDNPVILGDKFTTTSNSDYAITTTDSFYYIIVWLEDTGSLQEDEGSYQGTVTFTAKDDTNGKVTAHFGG